MSRTESHRVGGWLFSWQGGRLADVAHVSDLSRAVDAFEVPGWDWETGRSWGSRTGFEMAAAEWIEAYGATVYASTVREGVSDAR